MAARESVGCIAAMSLTVVGSIAFDAVKTPFGARERMLGGAATHFSLAASFFDEVRPVGPVGDDFGPEDWAVLQTRGTITDDVEHVPGGKTFFWAGEYSDNLNERVTHVDRPQRLRDLRAQALAGGPGLRRPLPGQHPARAAARRARAVHAVRASWRWTR